MTHMHNQQHQQQKAKNPLSTDISTTTTPPKDPKSTDFVSNTVTDKGKRTVDTIPTIKPNGVLGPLIKQKEHQGKSKIRL